MTVNTDGHSFLDRMKNDSRVRVEAARSSVPLEAIQERALSREAPPPLAVSREGFDIIAEVKLRSPSEGSFVREGIDAEARVTEQARSYSTAGAKAISVLTEPGQFSGDLEHIRWATAVTQTAVMRKDFLVDPYQLFEARAAGAGGVLLIARILEDDQLLSFANVARDLGMFVLLECFDRHDVDFVTRLWHRLTGDGSESSVGAPLLLGVNCRDLTTLKVEFDRLVELAPYLPTDAIAVAESGLETPEQAATLAAAGYRMALVGSALMRSAAPTELLAGLLEAGRGEAACASG